MAGPIAALIAKLPVPGAGSFSMSGITVIAIRLAGAALGLGAQVLASRHIGAEAFGYYALALVWLLLLGHGATAGTNQLVCRFLATYTTAGNFAAARGLLRFAFVLAGGTAIVVSLLAIGLVQSGVFGLDPDLVLLATLAFAVIPLIVLQDFLEAIARGLDRPTLGIAPAMLLRHLSIAAGVLALMVLGKGGDAVTIMGFTVAGLMASTAIQYLLIHKHLATSVGTDKPIYRIGFWFRTAMPIALLDAAEVLFNNADILILGLFMPAEIVAFYYAATRLSQMLGYVPYGITAATAQKYAALAANGNHRGLQSLVSNVVRLSTGLALVAALGLWLLSPLLLGLFGAGYEQAVPIVPLLCLGIVMVCALGPGEDILTMLGHERMCSAIFAVAVVANVTLNLALIPLWGMVGAAIATALALTLRGGLLAWVAYSRLGLALPLGSRLALASARQEAL